MSEDANVFAAKVMATAPIFVRDLMQSLAPEALHRVLVEIGEQLLRTAPSTDDCRISALWALREADATCGPQVAKVLRTVAFNAYEPESVRLLALDSLELVWLNGCVDENEVKQCWSNVAADPSVEIRCRWLRVLIEAKKEWALEQARSATAHSDLRTCLLKFLGNAG